MRSTDFGHTQFISRSVLEGFIGAAGLLIVVNQLPSLLGVASRSSASIIDGVQQVLTGLPHARPEALALGVGTVGLVLLLNHVSPKSATRVPLLPTHLLAILAAAGVVALLGLDARGVRVVGDLPRTLPPLHPPRLDADTIRTLAPGALAVALIGLIEAASIARSVASLSGDRIDPDREFIGQGLANIGAAIFSGMPVSGSLTRTQMLYRLGAATRLANVFAGLFVAAMVVVFSPLVRHIPVAALAGMLILIAANMVNWEHVRIALRATRADALAMLATFVVALACPLNTAIFMGVGVSLVLFLRRAQTPRLSRLVYDQNVGFCELGDSAAHPIPEISIVHIEGDVFFGAADTLERELLKIAQCPQLQVLILRMKRAHHVDATFILVLLKLHASLKEQGKLLLISGATPEVEQVFRRSKVDRLIGVENIFSSTPAIFQATGQALSRAVEHVNQKLGRDYRVDSCL